MIVSCPSCTSRYDLGPEEVERPMSLSCRHCGYHWKELPMLQLQDLSPRRDLALIEIEPEPELDVAGLVEAAKNSRIAFAAKRRQKFKTASGWASLFGIAILPFCIAMLAPEATVMAAPITAKFYQKLGWNVNVYGLDFRRIEQQNKNVDGEHVLLVKGEISNPTNDVRKIPSLRFALNDAEGKEVYTWTLDTTARPLRPGETTAFSTRLAAPPEAAKNLQIRFAHLDEIGSNPSP
jgi:hypothetical protein